MTTTTTTAKKFREESYNAYLAYVNFIKGNKTSGETVSALAPLFAEYGFTLTMDNLATMLTLRMTAYGMDKGEKARKIKSIATFRAFIKEGWKEVASAPVNFNAGKAPAQSGDSAKKTKKALEDELAELKAQLAKLTANRE